MYVVPPHSSTPRWMPSSASVTAMDSASQFGESSASALTGGCGFALHTQYSTIGRACKRRMRTDSKRKMDADDMASDEEDCGSEAQGDSLYASFASSSRTTSKRQRLASSDCNTRGASLIGQQIAELSPATFDMPEYDQEDFDGCVDMDELATSAPPSSPVSPLLSLLDKDTTGMAKFSDASIDGFPGQCLRLQISTPTGHPHPYIDVNMSAPPTPPKSDPCSPHEFAHSLPYSAGERNDLRVRFEAEEGTTRWDAQQQSSTSLPEPSLRSQLGASYFDPRF